MTTETKGKGQKVQSEAEGIDWSKVTVEQIGKYGEAELRAAMEASNEGKLSANQLDALSKAIIKNARAKASAVRKTARNLGNVERDKAVHNLFVETFHATEKAYGRGVRSVSFRVFRNENGGIDVKSRVVSPAKEPLPILRNGATSEGDSEDK